MQTISSFDSQPCPGPILPPNAPREQLLGATEVALWLGVSRAWVFEHANGRRRPYLPSVKLGRSVKFKPSAIEAFIVECERYSRECTLRPC